MANIRIGKLPPRYIFLLNPHVSLRLTKCPTCQKATYPRKFALEIAVQGSIPYVQGKTCKYCPRCEMILCDQMELETEMARSFIDREPESMGREYLVVGTISLKNFKQGLAGPRRMELATEGLADFKKHFTLNMDAGGWMRIGAPPRIITHAQAVACLSTPWKRRG